VAWSAVSAPSLLATAERAICNGVDAGSSIKWATFQGLPTTWPVGSTEYAFTEFRETSQSFHGTAEKNVNGTSQRGITVLIFSHSPPLSGTKRRHRNTLATLYISNRGIGPVASDVVGQTSTLPAL
jgi:hypothetical protein